MQISVSQRYVIEFTTEKGNTQYWTPSDDAIRVIDGTPFIALQAKDRGFAKFCGADLKQSSPMKPFKWLQTATAARNQAIRPLIEKLAADQIIGWKPGQR